MTKPIISLSDLLAKAEAATPGPWRADVCGEVVQLSDGGKGYKLNFYPDCEVVSGSTYGTEDVGILRQVNAEFIAAASPDVVKALVEALNAASKWSMSPSTFLGRHGFKP